MEKKKKGKAYAGYYFLGLVVFLYFFLFLFEPEKTQSSLLATGNLLVKIIPVLILVVFFMGIMNYFIGPQKVLKYVGKGSGIKGWFLAISTGILSHGPVYVWFPLLKELRDRGMRKGLVAAFLYNRSVKIPLLPVMIYYFGLTFAVVLLFYMVIASVVEGKIVETLEE
ncbi:permease [candidate division WOR-1 bacterium DG_54_3]|uniref:Permease n=1 Tax=candidate division WOR-1 bacterium DG_54_3 TaxID=1703775 RepID=A0A0S7Y284_UNCSA|nr:MAG: permease [candidate division WOR-1 bacterium DG_54_3]